MADVQPAAAPAAGGNAAPRREDENSIGRVMKVVQQIILVFVVVQMVTKFFGASTPPPPPAPVIPGAPDVVASQAPGADANRIAEPLKSAHLDPWWIGQPVDMHVCVSMSPHGDSCAVRGPRKELPRVVWENITFGDWKDSRVADWNVSLPKPVMHNASLWLDALVVPSGVSPDPRDPSFNRQRTVHTRKMLTRYFPKAKVRKAKSLVGSKADNEKDEEPEEQDVIVSHWHKNLTLALVSDAAPIPLDRVPAPVHPYIKMVHNMRDATGTIGYYNPILYPNDFWHLKEQYVEINTSTPVLPLQIVFQPMSYFKFQMFASLTVSFENAAQSSGTGTGAELDVIKAMLVETNPWFLGLTLVVSLLHMLFEMLAFTNDVSHWRNKKELVGVSVRTIFVNVFVQIVVLLYLIDNNENTSWMIILTSGMGVLVEAWKITKAVDIKLVAAPAGSLLPYKVQIKDIHVLSEDEKKTQEYDKLAFRYVSYVTIPLLGAYTIYSLIYETHRGWYSFVISTLTSFVYMFGFAQLIPQLIINYKLKSVSHMPMKAMIYKTLSTVVDDLFAFCIKMPFLHRLACFRDDVVFLVFLYQRWIYRIDPKRVNEYGQVMATDADAAATVDKRPLKEQATDKDEKGESKKNR